MMPEPTLGAQILASAMCLHIPAGSDEARGEWATLRSLCARAAAAERLAKAASGHDEALTDEGAMHMPGYRSETTDVGIVARLLETKEEYREALAAWRAINGEVG